MAKTAVTELTDYIESIRQEAYNEGYVAAMQAVVEFSTSGSAKPKTTATRATAARAAAIKKTAAKSTTATAAPRRQRHAKAKPAPRQTHRGDNAWRIAEAMMTLSNCTGPAAAIKKALAEKGHDIPYTSIRHGLGQLEARGRYRSLPMVRRGAIPPRPLRRSGEPPEHLIERDRHPDDGM
jgi:hypothetical protein